VIDFAGYGTTTQDALASVGRGGRVVQVGMGVLEATVSTSMLISKQASLVGSMGGSVDDVAQVYELMVRGELTPTIEVIRFEEIPEGLDRLRRGSVRGRLVAHIEDSAVGRSIDGAASMAPEKGTQ
jgi:propanol-preferring alcohol dehydrogenase